MRYVDSCDCAKDCLEHYRQTGTPPYCTLIFDVGKFSMAKQVPIISALRMGRFIERY